MTDNTIPGRAEIGKGPQHAGRIAALRQKLAKDGLDGFLIPHADQYQGEEVPPSDERLTWISGFRGSAGEAIVLKDAAAMRVDGRYTVQVAEQTDAALFDRLNYPDDNLSAWAAGKGLKKGAVIGYDPRLYTISQIKYLRQDLASKGIALKPVAHNPIDALWTDRPAAPQGKVKIYPDKYAGRTSAEKRGDLSSKMSKWGLDAAVLARPDSVAWLLNIRGADIAHTPLALSRAVLHKDGSVDWYINPAKVPQDVKDELGPYVRIFPPARLTEDLKAMKDKRVRVESAGTPVAVEQALKAGGAQIDYGPDPSQLPKAIKNKTEMAGMRAAHKRDGFAMIRFLAWLDAAAPKGGQDEMTAAAKLDTFRKQNDLYQENSFATISSTGPNGAIVHYRVSPATNRAIRRGDIYLVDSGGQYLDGTTDITRTVFIGESADRAPRAIKENFTRVLKGHIGIDRAIFPKGARGQDIDPLARKALWEVGRDYAHGTGHGVGCYLGVHEGPQSISSRGRQELKPGMVLSNEPGYYEDGAYGIRIENLIHIEDKELGGKKPFYGFETLTLCPIDLRLIDKALLNAEEKIWLNDYHARVKAELMPLVEALPKAERDPLKAWLTKSTKPLRDATPPPKAPPQP